MGRGGKICPTFDCQLNIGFEIRFKALDIWFLNMIDFSKDLHLSGGLE